MFRRFFAFLLAFLFISIFVPVAIFFGIFRIFAGGNLYHGPFIERAYNILLAELPRVAHYQEISVLTEAEMRELFAKTFSKDDLEEYVEKIIDSIENARVNDSTLTIVFPMDWFADEKSDLASGLSDFLYERLPVCQDKMAELEVDINGDIECIPEDYPRPDFRFEMESMLDRALFAHLPSESIFTLGLYHDFNGKALDILKRIFDFLFLGVVVILFVLLLIIALLIWKPWHRILSWLSLTIFLSTLLIAVYLLVFMLLPVVFKKPLINEFTGLEIYLVYKDMYYFVLGALAKNILIFVLPLLLISLGTFVFNILMERKKTHDTS